MYSEIFPALIPRLETIGRTAPLETKGVVGLLEKRASGSVLTVEEIAALMNSLTADPNRKAVLEFSAAFRRPHDREILMLPPLYFSSVCENVCPYCEFRSAGKRLSAEEFGEEVRALLDLGYRNLELVSSQDPDLFRKKSPFIASDQKFDVAETARYFDLARREQKARGGGLLFSNIPPLDTDSLGRLHQSGLDVYLSWMECFDPVQYAHLHRKDTPKGHHAYRLDAFERALRAGIPFLAGAFLKGLFDWRREEAALYLFDQWLRQSFGSGFSVIGTPRLKGAFADTDTVRDYRMSDEDYELNVALDRVLFDGILWLQTRETPEFNVGLIRRYGGGVILTVDCSTAPGGYRRPAKVKPQFPVYRQDIRRAVRAYEDLGYSVRFDWNADTLKSFQRSA